MKKILTPLFLSLSLISVSARADDNTLIVEANRAYAQKDYNAAFSRFSILAQHGNGAAQYSLGSLYLNGQGVKKDYKQAFYWYQKSASHGRANAQYILGLMCQNGLGTAQDNMQAIEWFRKSAVQGNAPALEALKKLAAQGNGEARNALSKMQQSASSAPRIPPPQSQPQSVVASPKKDAAPLGESVPKISPTTPAISTGPQKADKSFLSDFSLGINLGQTGKLNGITNSSSIGLLVGYKINESFGLELAYNSLYRNANADELVSVTNPGTTGTFDLKSFSLSGQYTYPISSTFSLLGNLGVHSSSFNLTNSGVLLNTGTSTGLLAGLKIQYEVSRNVGIRAGIDVYTESGDITGTLVERGLGAIYRF